MLRRFHTTFVASGVGDREHEEVLEQIRRMLQGDSINLDSSAEDIRRFLDHVQKLFDRMDASLNFR